MRRKNQSIIPSDKDFPDAGKISGVREHLSLSWGDWSVHCRIHGSHSWRDSGICFQWFHGSGCCFGWFDCIRFGAVVRSGSDLAILLKEWSSFSVKMWWYLDHPLDITWNTLQWYLFSLQSLGKHCSYSRSAPWCVWLVKITLMRRNKERIV